MHMDCLLFLHTISEDLKFRTISSLLLETKKSLKEVIINVINMYYKEGYYTKYIDTSR